MIHEDFYIEGSKRVPKRQYREEEQVQWLVQEDLDFGKWQPAIWRLVYSIRAIPIQIPLLH